jgi:serine O-acetyltransferase
LIDGLHDKLTQQIGRALRHDAGATKMCDNAQDFEALGQAKAVQFLEELPRIRHALALDVEAAYAGDPAVKKVNV